MNELKWYDISGHQVINIEEQGIFASVLATCEADALNQFYSRFPYGCIDSMRVLLDILPCNKVVVKYCD